MDPVETNAGTAPADAGGAARPYSTEILATLAEAGEFSSHLPVADDRTLVVLKVK